MRSESLSAFPSKLPDLAAFNARIRERIDPWLDRVCESVPDIEPLDAHTHIGFNDPDEFSCSGEQLTRALEQIGARAFVFPMHEPDGYGPANDMVIAEAEATDGRLFPLCRLDPNAKPSRQPR